MGILEEIKESLAELHKKVDALGTGAPAAAAGAKDKKPATKKADKPEFTAEQLRDKFLECQQKHGDAATKALIAELGHDKLAKLIADAPNWQKAWDAVTAKIEEEADDGDDSGL